MDYAEDPKAITKKFIKFFFDILEKAKDEVCIDPESEDCVQLSKTDLTTLKNVFIKDPSATLDKATAQLLPYKALIKQLLAQRIDPPNGNEAKEALEKELRRKQVGQKKQNYVKIDKERYTSSKIINIWALD